MMAMMLLLLGVWWAVNACIFATGKCTVEGNAAASFALTQRLRV
jgi:hypothetical protein